MSEHPKINPDADIVARLESEPLTIHLAGEAAEEIRRLRAAMKSVRYSIKDYLDDDGGTGPLEDAIERIDESLNPRRTS